MTEVYNVLEEGKSVFYDQLAACCNFPEVLMQVTFAGNYGL